MRQRIDRDIERDLLAVFGADALASVAGVVGAEGAAQAVLAHHGDQVAFVKKSFKLNVALLIQASDAVNLVE